MDNMNFQDKIKFFNNHSSKPSKIKTSNVYNIKVKKLSPKKIPFTAKKFNQISENTKEGSEKSNSYDDKNIENNVDPLLSSILEENNIELFDEFKFDNRK